MGIGISIVFPALPVLVSYRYATKLTLFRPVTAWAMLNATQDVREEAWLEKAKVQKNSDRELGHNLATSLAYPRYFAFRRLGKDTRVTWKAGYVKNSNMSLFRGEGFKAALQTGKLFRTILPQAPGADDLSETVNGFKPQWSQIPCREHPAPKDMFCDKGEASIQIANGMPCSSNITYLRLDLHSHPKMSKPPADAPTLSILFRGVIVEKEEKDELQNWRAWKPSDDVVMRLQLSSTRVEADNSTSITDLSEPL